MCSRLALILSAMAIVMPHISTAIYLLLLTFPNADLIPKVTSKKREIKIETEI